MPTKKIIDRLKNADPETKQAIFDERADSVNEEKNEKIKKTAEKQYIPLDKTYMALLMIARNTYLHNYDLLTDEEKYDLGLRGPSELGRDEILYDREDQLIRGAVDSLMEVPPTLQDFENYYSTLGLISAKAAHELAKAREEIRKELPGDLDEQTKDDMADYLVGKADVLPNRILQGVEAMFSQLDERSFRQNGNDVEYIVQMSNLLTADFTARLNGPEGRTMTVSEYCALAKMTEEEQALFLKNSKCSADDRVYDVYYQKEKDDAEKRGQVFNSEEEMRNTFEREAIKKLANNYVSKVSASWKRSGAEKYEKGLQGAERKEYQKGVKLNDLLGKERREFEDKMEERFPDLKALDKKFRREFIFKGFRKIDEYILSEKPLMMREEPGLSESYSAGKAIYTEKMFATKGALLALEGTGSTWKYHSENSKSYEKMVTAIKKYHRALAANEGGKALSRRNEMYLAIRDYIDDKYPKRRSPEGQLRFNTALTLLYQELTPAKFQELLQNINAKRGENDKITLDSLASRKQTFIVNAKNNEQEVQEATKDFATDFPNRYGYELAELDTAIVPGPGEAYPAIGLRGNETLGNLSNRDYTAIAYSCALSLPKKNDLLINDDLLHPSDEQIADGKRMANAALQAYGQGNKQRLGELLSIAIRRTGQEIKSRADGTEKTVMTEINTRVRNMLERDPELKKYALRNQLKETGPEEGPAAGAGNKGREKTAENGKDNRIILG